MNTKTVDVRLLVSSEVDDDALVEQLITATYGPGAPLGAVQLQGESPTPTTRVATRSNVRWDGVALFALNDEELG